jgi:hypothetical protein
MPPPPPGFAGTPFGANSKRLYDEADQMWLAHARLARRWTRLHYFFGLSTTSLAAVAGFGGLGDLFGKRAAAYLALAAAVVAAVATFLKTDDQRKHHEGLAASCENLRDDVATIYSTAVGYVVPPARRTWTERNTAKVRASNAPREEKALPPDPYGWESVVDALHARVKTLRTGQSDEGTVPTWPKRPRKSASREPAE